MNLSCGLFRSSRAARRSRLLALLPFVLASGARGAAAGDEPAPVGFEALVAFDKLPLLADRPAYQDSSYHRANINQDAGNFLRVEPNGDQVLTDADGPGVIYRFWSTGVVGMQMSDQCRVRFYFDGEETPRLDLSMAEIFGAKGSRWPFVPPLSVTFESGQGGGEGPCNLCYVPIPFAKHLRIVGRNVMFYHVDYHTLPAGTPLESFSWDLAERNRAALERAADRFNRAGERPGSAAYDRVEILADRSIAPGGSERIAIEGEGMIGMIALDLAERSPAALRGTVLEIAFEKPEAVCVRVPCGDFFGSGCGDRRFASLPCGMAENGYYAYWPMPFRTLAVVAVRNDTASPVRLRKLQVGAFRGSQPANAGYFHARYVQNPDIPMGTDYRILELAGRGKFVGANVTMQNARGAQGIFFLEGDEKIYVDGETYPSRWLGTGTEDYFNGAYFWNAPNKAAMARPYGGLTFLDWGIGRVCAYRWHVTDSIGFKDRIAVDLEHGGVSDWPCNYQSVAYYYLEKPQPQPPLPALADRLPRTPLPPAPAFQCCALAGAPRLGGTELKKSKFSELDPEFESNDTAFVGRGKGGDAIEAPLDLPGADNFSIAVFVPGGPDFAPLAVAIDGDRLGSIDARKEAFTPWFGTEFGPRRLAGGRHALELRIEGAGGAAENLAAGLVAVQLKPRSRLIDAWSVVGNWPCPKEGGWGTAYDPEKRQDLSASYALPAGRTATWREHTGDFVGLGGGDWMVAYGLTYIRSPDDRSVPLFIAKDDGMKVWINDAVVFDQNTWSHPWPDQFFCSTELKKGWNKVLVKCANWNGGWGFALRPGDPDNVLTFARQPEGR